MGEYMEQSMAIGCREDQIPEPGDYICTNIGVESVLIVRQYDGGFKAFHNVCMHRGNRLADEGVGHAAICLRIPWLEIRL